MLFLGIVLITLGLQIWQIMCATPLHPDTIWLRLLEFAVYMVPAICFGMGIRLIVKDVVRDMIKK